MRPATQTHVLQRLIDAAGDPVSDGELAHWAVARLGPRDQLVVDDDRDDSFPRHAASEWLPDEARGSAWWEPGGEAGVSVPIAVDMLRQEGWVIKTTVTAVGVARALVGRRALPGGGELAPPPPATLPEGLDDQVRAWMLSGGHRGRPHSTIHGWVSPERYPVMDDVMRGVLARLAEAGVVVDSWQEGSTIWYRIVATRDVPLEPPPPPGADAAMIAMPGQPRPEPVGATEIAERAGVNRSTVEAWTRRHPSFPGRQWVVGGRPAWEWGQVRAWLEATGRAVSEAGGAHLGGRPVEAAGGPLAGLAGGGPADDHVVDPGG